jgi:hypothetical protein
MGGMRERYQRARTTNNLQTRVTARRIPEVLSGLAKRPTIHNALEKSCQDWNGSDDG